MSRAALENLLPTLNMIDPNKVEPITISVPDLIEEAVLLSDYILEDQLILMTVGIPENIFDLFPWAIEALKTAESLLQIARGCGDDKPCDMLLRNRAYTFLKSMVSSIREAGQYLFWEEEERKAPYMQRVSPLPLRDSGGFAAA